MKVWDQKEEESLTPAINYTVMRNSSLTEVENVSALFEPMRNIVCLWIWWNHRKTGFLLQFVGAVHSLYSQRWNTSGQAGTWAFLGPTFRRRGKHSCPTIQCRPSLNCMKNMILAKTETTVIVIGVRKGWHGSHQGKSETTAAFNNVPAQAKRTNASFHAVDLSS